MAPLVSVLIPAYNAEPYVAAAIASIEAQTFGDWEIVAVDDASTDRTAGILESRASAQIRIDRNPLNLGMTANWNRCLSLARGELVLKLDADDALKPRALEVLVKSLAPGAVAAGIRSLQCDEALEPYDGIQGDDAMLRNGINPYADAIHDGSRWYDIAALGFQLWSSSAFMFRRDLASSIGGWDERFGCASDTELMWRVLEQGRPVAHNGEVGTLYRVRRGSVSDEYRKRGWLTWEATAGNLLSLHRVRARRPITRAMRMHYVRLWERWQSGRTGVAAAIRANLEGVMREVAPPPLPDRIMTWARDKASA